jgi:hypothetical protein
MSNYDDVGGTEGMTRVRDPRGDSGTYGPSAVSQPLPVAPYGYELRPRRVHPIETKPFFLTSEFVGAVLAIAGIAITAAASDSFGAWRAWILISAITVGYMVSRGIAKSGTRSHADDPREHFDLRGRGREQDGH